MESKYLTPGVMTGLGKSAGRVAALPGDFGGIAGVLHGLCIHEFLTGMYGVDKVDTSTVHLRRAEDLLDTIGEPLDVAREPGDRMATNCRGFTVLAVAMLRAHGVPARARCGFGGYFNPGFWVDHWVVEYYEDGRWKRGDAQLDGVLLAEFKIDFDPDDLPDGQFLTGGEAWELFRRGGADPDTFGLGDTGAGDWWIAGNLVRDVAAMDNVEALPWDCWDPMPKPSESFDYQLFDHLDTTKVPDTVYNAVRDRVEPFR
ncbi:transglutaminase-like domain-containing protein [Actinoplanes sp. NPDC051343]|uniref:transglutaminase-like domain-containing protein n=1 Tax=Actinoplanes sp. NPDC051343 TaxID=3363906 RepID=UPI0037BC463B